MQRLVRICDFRLMIIAEVIEAKLDMEAEIAKIGEIFLFEFAKYSCNGGQRIEKIFRKFQFYEN